MLVKFFSHGTGSAGGAVDYLLGYNRDRVGAEVLSGDPDLTVEIIKSIDRKSKYKSGVLSFEEQAEDVSQQAQKEIMQKFEDTLFPNLDPDQYNILWVRHTDKGGRLELNFVIPTVELRSGKRLQPYYARADKVRVNAFKDLVNIEHKLSDPNEPSKKRLTNAYSPTNPRPTPYNTRRNKQDQDEDDAIIDSPPNRDALRDAVNRRLEDMHRAKRITDANDVLHVLDGWGLTVKRDSKTYKTLTHPRLTDKNGKPLPVRVKSEIALCDYNRRDHTPDAVARATDTHNDYRKVIYRQLVAQNTYDTAMDIKRDYHAKQYTTPPPPTVAISTPEVAVTPATSPNTPVTQPQPTQTQRRFRP